MIWAGKGSPAIPFIRVPDSTEGDIQKAVDNGALGIIIPMVESVEKARAGVKFAKFPPLGKRSQGGGQYGALWGNDYRQTANDNIMVVRHDRVAGRGGHRGSDRRRSRGRCSICREHRPGQLFRVTNRENRSTKRW